MKPKIKKISFIFLVFFSIISVVYVFTKIKTSPPNIPNPASTPELVFELLKISPNEGKQEIPIANFAIEFTFSKKINLSSLAVKSEPKTDLSFNTDQGGKIVYLYPNKDWIYGQKYTITLTIQSEKGEVLNGPIVYTFTPQRLKDSDLNESNLR